MLRSLGVVSLRDASLLGVFDNDALPEYNDNSARPLEYNNATTHITAGAAEEQLCGSGL